MIPPLEDGVLPDEEAQLGLGGIRGIGELVIGGQDGEAAEF